MTLSVCRRLFKYKSCPRNDGQNCNACTQGLQQRFPPHMWSPRCRRLAPPRGERVRLYGFTTADVGCRAVARRGKSLAGCGGNTGAHIPKQTFSKPPCIRALGFLSQHLWKGLVGFRLYRKSSGCRSIPSATLLLPHHPTLEYKRVHHWHRQMWTDLPAL